MNRLKQIKKAVKKVQDPNNKKELAKIVDNVLKSEYCTVESSKTDFKSLNFN